MLLLLFAPVVIRAEQAPAANDRLPFMADSQRDNLDQAPSTGGLLLRTVGALLLIVGLILAASWGMKRFAGARFGAPKEDAPQLAILNSLSLGDKKSLAIVRSVWRKSQWFSFYHAARGRRPRAFAAKRQPYLLYP